ncbi:BQ5605_C003g02218 [Microbotryum silenes-dioicae]|uniref:BQ5605_C003g02218 protein n=1 Tax=Microbotryum silenes-dioicae TaxID=796604 RepID=A0A2X0M101_9BASI|nr:BQ5605_C003g02218 [Microbotryum silenes-dioicae]
MPRECCHHSDRALLHYLYTDPIIFAPLASTYHVARDAALAFDTPFPFSSRRVYLLANTPWPQSKGGGGPCSAKAMYRMADKLGLPELKERAYYEFRRLLYSHMGLPFLHLIKLPYEVFSLLAARFNEIQRVESAFLLERRWNEIEASHGLRKVFALIRGNCLLARQYFYFGCCRTPKAASRSKHIDFEEVWLGIIDYLEVTMTPEIEGADMRI